MGSGGQGPRGACAGRLWSALADQAHEISLQGRGKRRLKSYPSKSMLVRRFTDASSLQALAVTGTC